MKRPDKLTRRTIVKVFLKASHRETSSTLENPYWSEVFAYCFGYLLYSTFPSLAMQKAAANLLWRLHELSDYPPAKQRQWFYHYQTSQT